MDAYVVKEHPSVLDTWPLKKGKAGFVIRQTIVYCSIRRAVVCHSAV